MNVAEANQIVSALNYIAELVTALAADVEKQAWQGFEDHAGMPGERPVAAAQLAQPALASTAPPVTEPVEEEPAPQVSLEQVRGVLAELSGKGLTGKVRELILATGASKLSEVDPGKYAWLLDHAEGLDHA